MAFYHVRLSVKEESSDEVKTDLDEDRLHRQFLEPYRKGRPLTVNGRAVQPDQIRRLRVSRSVEPSAAIADRLRSESRASSVLVVGGPSMAWRVANRATDVTDELILGPPGYDADVTEAPREPTEGVNNAPVTTEEKRDRVFLVEGRDGAVSTSLKGLLRAIGLSIIEWEQAVAATGEANPFTEDIVLAGFELAHGAVVLFTGDDEVRLREDLWRSSDGPAEREIRYQPRPNVLYEAGLARAYFPTRTVVVSAGLLKGLSDRAGRHDVRLDGSPGSRRRLLNRLEIAGFDIDDSGEDWLTVGDFRPTDAEQPNIEGRL